MFLPPGGVRARRDGLRHGSDSVQGEPQGAVQEGAVLEGAREVQGGLQLHHQLHARYSPGNDETHAGPEKSIQHKSTAVS